jgi:methionine biosynthesis protein MetW
MRQLLKGVVPKSVREQLHETFPDWIKINEPAPLNDFEDYNEYWKRRGKLDVILRRWQLAAEHVPANSSLLDYGCGTGEFLTYVHSARTGVAAQGLDISATAVEMARAAGIDAAVLVPDQTLGVYDYVTCFEVLEHIPDAEVVLRQLARSFRKQLIISIPNVGALNCRIRLAVFGRFPITRCVMHVKEHVRHWTPTDFAEWVKKEDLKIVKTYGDWGLRGLPWKLCPSLFAKGIVYVLERNH